MARLDDVRRLALGMPGAQERRSRGHCQWRVNDRLFVWERPLRPREVQELGDRAPEGDVLGARVEHLIAKEALLAADPAVFFTTSHFEGFPAVLVRLERISVAALEEVVVEAWLARASRRAVEEYLAARPTGSGGTGGLRDADAPPGGRETGGRPGAGRAPRRRE